MGRWRTVGLVTGVLAMTVAEGTGAQGAGGVQGVWVVVRAERDGRPADDLRGNRLTLSGDRFTIDGPAGARLYAGTFTATGAGTSSAIDFDHAEGTLRGLRWLGIVRLEGDELRICDNAGDLRQPRPAAFATAPGSGHVCLTFRRQGE